jgi:hypothetical protein
MFDLGIKLLSLNSLKCSLPVLAFLKVQPFLAKALMKTLTNFKISFVFRKRFKKWLPFLQNVQDGLH